MVRFDSEISVTEGVPHPIRKTRRFSW